MKDYNDSKTLIEEAAAFARTLMKVDEVKVLYDELELLIKEELNSKYSRPPDTIMILKDVIMFHNGVDIEELNYNKWITLNVLRKPVTETITRTILPKIK